MSLGELFTIHKGRKPITVLTTPDAGARRLLQINDLRGEGPTLYTRGGAGTIADANDVIIAWDGANAGTVGFGLEGVAGSTLAVLRPASERIHTPYAGRFLQSQFRLLNRSTDGAAVPHVNRRLLESLAIPLPPLAEQRRIAAVLDKADAVRRKRRESLRLLDEFLRSAFLEMFGDPVRNEKGWQVVNLEDVLSRSLRNGLSPADGGGVAAQVLTLTAITGSRFESAAVKTGYFAHRAAPDQIADPEDFLICRGNGNLRLMGRAKFPRGVAAMTVFPDTMIAARIDQSRVEPSYIEAVWETAVVRRSLERGARTTSGIHKINQSVLLSTGFPLPAIEKQRRYAQVAERVERLRERLSDGAAGNLFDSLAQRAFGER